jgi:hypothetical protein
VIWDRGSQVVVRSRPSGGGGYTFPAIVVCDSAEAIALFQPAGTVCKRRRGPRGGPTGRNLLSWDGSYENVVFPILDIEVADDLSEWRWKDEAELTWAIDHGTLSTEEADAVRRDGLVAIERAKARTRPFGDDWPKLQPDAGWSIPVLPAAWDRADVSVNDRLATP